MDKWLLSISELFVWEKAGQKQPVLKKGAYKNEK